MKIGLATVCFNEERLIGPFLRHLPEWIEKKVVLVSTKPWFGEEEEQDKTATIAREEGATVVENHWESETDQRNTGLSLLSDCDWVVIMDTDEFFDDEGWEILRATLEQEDEAEALVTEGQFTYYKDGVADPPKDCLALVAVHPWTRFVDKRVSGAWFKVIPKLWVHHMSWRRSDEEVYRKITHYAHAHDFDTEKWYKEVWLADKRENVHPTTPETLSKIIPAKLPPELEKLGI